MSNSPKLLLFSDLHADERNLPVVERFFSQLVDAVKQQVPDGLKLVVFSGDMFHRRGVIPVRVMGVIYWWLQELRKHSDVLLVPGNHDFTLDDESGTHALETLEISPDSFSGNSVTVSKFDYLWAPSSKFAPYSVVALPFYSSPEKLRKALDRVIDDCYDHDEAAEHGAAAADRKHDATLAHTVLIGHQAVTGAKNLGHVSDSDIPSWWFDKFRAVFFGDYHEPQKVGPVQYVGGAFQHNFGDAGGERGPVLYDFATNTFTRLSLDLPQFVTVELRAEDLADRIAADGRPEGVYIKPGDSLRIRITGTKQELQRIDSIEWRNRVFEALGAHLTVELVCTDSADARITEEGADKLIEAALEAYLKNFPPTTGTDVVKVREAALELIGMQKQGGTAHITSKSLVLKNWKSYANQSLAFEPGAHLLTGRNLDEGGSNGSGKTSLLTPISFAWFGTTEEARPVDSFMRRGEDKLSVTYSLTVSSSEGSKEVEIIREKTRAGSVKSTIKENGVPVANKKDDVDRYISELLRMDQQLFHSTVFLSQEGRRSFAKATDGERRAQLSKILQTEPLDSAFSSTKARLQQVSSARTKTEGLLSNTEAEMRGAGSVESLEAQARGYEAQRTEQVGLSESRIRTASEEAAGLRSQLQGLTPPQVGADDALEAAIRKHRETLQGKDKVVRGRAAWEAKLSEYRMVERRAAAEIGKVEVEAARIKANFGNVCQTCGQPVSEQGASGFLGTLQNKVQMLRDEIAEQGPKKVEAESAIVKYDSALMQLMGIERDLREAEAQREQSVRAQMEYTSAKSRIEYDLGRVETRISSYQSEAAELRSRPNPYTQLVNEAKDRIAKLNATRGALSEALSELLAQETFYTYLIGLFGPKGIRSLMFDFIVRDIESKARTILSAAFPNVSLEIRTTKEGTTGVKDEITIALFTGTEEVPIGAFSGGEQAIIRLSVDLATALVAQARLRVVHNIMVLDEQFEHMDAERVQQLVEILHQLSSKVPCIYVITHVDLSASRAFPNEIQVTKRTGVSSVTAIKNREAA